MKRIVSCTWAAVVVLVTTGAIDERAAHALVSDTPLVSPPDGWQNICVAQSLDVKPTVASRQYAGTGTCWINTAQDKSDSSKQNWIRVAVTLKGVWALQSSSFAEDLSFALPTGTVPVTTHGSCSDDPWAKSGQCGATPPNVDLYRSFGWPPPTTTGPLSRNVFGSALVTAILSKQLSSPPLAPVDLDPVRWPEPEGTVGRIFWRTPDVSGNRWILAYDIEYASSPDSAFLNAGRVMGPGATTNLTPKDVSRYFYTSLKLSDAATYFRVCSVNDAGRQCSAAKVARQPTAAELMVVSRTRRVAAPALAGSPPAAGGGSPGVPVTRPVAPAPVTPAPPPGVRVPVGPR
jgi:hypothetical protein